MSKSKVFCAFQYRLLTQERDVLTVAHERDVLPRDLSTTEGRKYKATLLRLL